MDLNTPDTRQHKLALRLQGGTEVVAQAAAREFNVSLDTIRRDILALEQAGKAIRVRGGAVPVAPPMAPLQHRLETTEPLPPALIDAAVAQIGAAATVLMDGGTTTLALVPHLTPLADRLIITPSPWIAVKAQGCGCAVYLLGGRLSALGGIAVGAGALAEGRAVSADVAVLGACGLDARFGLSSDDPDEALMKQGMAAAARRTVVVTERAKLGRRARHQTLPLSRIDCVVTNATEEDARALERGGTSVCRR